MRSSDTIAELAGALAMAQVELQNPPKSLIAYLETGHDGSPGQAYRYAPLSAGLEIVRKALGQHGIAVVQTTELDPGTGTLMLTTTLAHASGEWMASFWPVCGKPEMAHPKLMGSALTYARRYSLFAVVGLAGEDDLDAPELTSRHSGADVMSPGTARPTPARAPSGPLNRPSLREAGLGQTSRPGRGHDGTNNSAPPLSAPALGDLLHGLEQVESADALLRWAISALPACSRLEGPERASLEAAFLTRAEADLLLAFRKPGRRSRRRDADQGAISRTETVHVP